jgi:hypothetical protein
MLTKTVDASLALTKEISLKEPEGIQENFMAADFAVAPRR